MSKIAITDYFDSPSPEEQEILGDLVSATPGPETEVLLVWHQRIDEQYATQFPKLRGVQRYGVGFDNLDLEYLKSRGIICANNPDYGVDEVSDTALAFVMNISRGVTRYDTLAQKLKNTWQENVLTDLRRSCNTTVGVIGAGRIGSSVLLKCEYIGFKTILFDPYKPTGYEKVIKAKRAETLDELLSGADIVSIHCPLNAETKGMVNREFVSKMRRGASLINTARGGIIEHNDVLYSALKMEWLGAACLDVLPEEPPGSDPLIDGWRNGEESLKGRLFITPHTSYYSQQSVSEMRRSAAANALRMMRLEMPRNRL